MLLRTLRIRHFRGVASADLELDDSTTLWIGENDCGKSTLLEALAIALGSGDPASMLAFGPQHLHHVGSSEASEVAALPSIELCFEERQPGEVPAKSPLARLLGKASARPRALRLHVEGKRRGNDLVTSFVISGAAATRAVDDAALLEALRRMQPLVWIRGGMWLGAELFSATATPEAGALQDVMAPELAALASELEARYARVVSGASPHAASDLTKGAEAAEALLQLGLERARASQLADGAVVSEIMGFAEQDAIERKRSRLGSAAQRIGVLMLVAALVRNARAALGEGVDPLVLVEDPEAHLHPMTLATVWDLLAQIGWQKIVTTQSGVLLAAAPLARVRRLVREQGRVHVYALGTNEIGRDALRRFSYHVRFRHGSAMFARAWLLVEGETEFWLLTEVARLMGFDLRQEGVAVVEFAQSGLAPLTKVADAFGIGWHVLTDGDTAGDSYVRKARALASPRSPQAHVTRLPERDIEHCFFVNGYKPVFVRRAKLGAAAQAMTASRIIRKAIERDSKPAIAFALLEAARAPRSPGVPKPLRQAIEQVLKLAWAPPVAPRPAR